MTALPSGALDCDYVEPDRADRQRRENCLRAVVRLPRRAAQGAEHLKGSAVSANPLALAPVEDITRVIRVLRGHKVLLDTELATLYGVTTKRFNEQVRRNNERFPADFMFQLTAEELASLRSQNATSKAPPQGRGGRRYLPYAFTEHGAIMAAMILNSPRAMEMSVYVVRAFVHLRELLSSNRELARRFAQLETRLDKKLTEHDLAIAAILSAIRELMHPTPPKRRPIGFTADLEKKS